MSKEGHEILAVQTLRNAIMGPVFLGSTAVLLMIGTLTLTGVARSNQNELEAVIALLIRPLQFEPLAQHLAPTLRTLRDRPCMLTCSRRQSRIL